ncbi:MAG: DegT/DnrJ/EryC1/StrS family aminotransferase [candidate division WOR-3 bacterium]|nr:MAG: DegT/DnrJ/EryC1/StrS family aminotransferase [candidate division WOR-3 bacterium]
MRVPLVDLKAQYPAVGREIEDAIRLVRDRSDFVSGLDIGLFEKEFAKYLECAEVVGVASGTAALHLALLACGIGPGDEVITAAHTFAATGEAIVHVGARPVFVDIDESTYLIDSNLVEAAITPRTKAIVPVHLYGQPCDMDSLFSIASRHGLMLVEDAAQAHGATFKGRRCGTLGHVGCFSFYPGKNLGAWGDAGAVSTNDRVLAAKVRQLRDHGRSGKYQHDLVGFGERLDTIQAAVLRVKLRRLDEWNHRRRERADNYRTLLGGLLTLPAEREHAESVYHLFVVRTRARDALLEHLRGRGISAGVHYPVPLHRQPAFANAGFADVELPTTERVVDEILSLPMYPELTKEQLDFVVETIISFLQGFPTSTTRRSHE